MNPQDATPATRWAAFTLLVAALAAILLGFACQQPAPAGAQWAYADEAEEAAGDGYIVDYGDGSYLDDTAYSEENDGALPDEGYASSGAATREGAEDLLEEMSEEELAEYRHYAEADDGSGLPIENWDYQVVSVIDTLFVLDVSDASAEDGANVQLRLQDGAASQSWRFRHVEGDWYGIVNSNSGKALDVEGGSTDSRANVIQFDYRAASNQLWKPVLNSDGTYSFVNKSGRALAVPSDTLADGITVWQFKRDENSKKQRFYLRDAPNTEARGHWEYKDLTQQELAEETIGPSEGGDAIAAAAVALSGYAARSMRGVPHGSSVYERPPNVGHGGDWTVYNNVTSVIRAIRHAACSDGVSVAVRYSGVDDGFPVAGCRRSFQYMMASPKWERVGGRGKYWHRNSELDGGWGDSGVDLQPGDVLVRKEVETENFIDAHICIYVGAEHANMKYPDSNLTWYEESYTHRYWAFLNRSYAGGEYCVLRRNNTDLDIAGSQWAGVRADAKAKYSVSSGISRTVRTTVTSVKDEYIYEDYSIAYHNLPEGSRYEGVASYRYNSDDFALGEPALTEDYEFEGWWTEPEGGSRVTTIPRGTMGDLDIYAHTKYIPSHYLRYENLPDDVTAPEKWYFKENAEDFELEAPAVPDGYGWIFEGWWTGETGGEQVSVVRTGTTEDVTVYAHWTSIWLTFPYIIAPLSALAALIAAIALVWRRRRARS